MLAKTQAKTQKTAQVPLSDFGAAGGEPLALPENVFARGYNAALAHQVLTSVQANARTATRQQKTRAEVRHTTRKLFRQKGTGRARAGHLSTPIRRGGGRAFPASPADNFQRKLSRKMYRLALAVILSQLAREERIRVVRALAADSHKTRDLCKSLAAMGVAGKKILLVDTECDEKLTLASRNLARIKFLQVRHLLPTDLVGADVAIFSQKAVEQLKELRV